jgi:hypothetical protein
MSQPTPSYGSHEPHDAVPPTDAQADRTTAPDAPGHGTADVRPAVSSPYLDRPGTPAYGAPDTPYGVPTTGATTSPWAIVALVLGLMGTAVVAVVVGHVALAQIRRTGQGGAGLAIAGLVLGYLEIVAYAVLIIWTVVVVGTLMPHQT